MERIAEDVRRELGRFGAPGGMLEVLEHWPEAVGPEIARNAWPSRIARDGTLHVATSSAAWAFELTQLAPEILGRLSEGLAGNAPEAVRFAPGHLPEPAAVAASAVSGPAPPPGPQELAAAAELVAGIDDEELREQVRRAAALSLVNRGDGRSV